MLVHKQVLAAPVRAHQAAPDRAHPAAPEREVLTPIPSINNNLSKCSSTSVRISLEHLLEAVAPLRRVVRVHPAEVLELQEVVPVQAVAASIRTPFINSSPNKISKTWIQRSKTQIQISMPTR